MNRVKVLTKKFEDDLSEGCGIGKVPEKKDQQSEVIHGMCAGSLSRSSQHRLKID